VGQIFSAFPTVSHSGQFAHFSHTFVNDSGRHLDDFNVFGITIDRLHVLTAAKVYDEDWTINSMEKLRQTDRKCHGRDGYLVSELIPQVTQTRFGELISEEAKGKAWDEHRIFFVGEYGSTENLMKSMAATLRQAVPHLVNLSPTLTEALIEIEGTIKAIHRNERAPNVATERRCRGDIEEARPI
jgi:hypothetical protein